MKNKLLPLDLQYLFQNKYLDCVKILIILYPFKRRKKGTNLDELNYYYTMIDLLDRSHTQGYEFNHEYFQDNYLINEECLRSYGILLKNQNLLDIKIEKTSKNTILYYKLSTLGMQLVEGLENEYFHMITDRYNFIDMTLKYSQLNQRKVLSRNEK